MSHFNTADLHLLNRGMFNTRSSKYSLGRSGEVGAMIYPLNSRTHS